MVVSWYLFDSPNRIQQRSCWIFRLVRLRWLNFDGTILSDCILSVCSAATLLYSTNEILPENIRPWFWTRSWTLSLTIVIVRYARRAYIRAHIRQKNVFIPIIIIWHKYNRRKKNSSRTTLVLRAVRILRRRDLWQTAVVRVTPDVFCDVNENRRRQNPRKTQSVTWTVSCEVR